MRNRFRIPLITAATAALFVAGFAYGQGSTPGSVLDAALAAIQGQLDDHEQRIGALENPPTTTEPPPTTTEPPPTTTEPPPTTTEPPPTTTEPPPPPPPAGTSISVTDRTWECRQPVADLATNGLPLRVTVNFTRNFPGQAVFLAQGCVGDGTNATDLVLDVRGDGVTHGAQDDAIRLANATPGPSDLQIEGHADCGNQAGTSYHQDGVHVIGGTNVTFRNFTIGDYDAGEATCQGAGGVMFITGSTPSNTWPTNIRVEGGKYIGCNHAFNNGGQGTGHVEGASFRSGRTDGSHPKCDPYASSPPCLFGGLVTRGPGVVCERWLSGRWEDVE